MQNNPHSYHKLEKVKQYINQQIGEIENDERYKRENADVMINAPLALTQIALRERRLVLRKINQIIHDEGVE
ncbi:MAG: hypothetical protein K0U45_05580 [Alphaproteobacteria bacterium]|nr:hypothetical protein [Alphaproteobacteria bacterium]